MTITKDELRGFRDAAVFVCIKKHAMPVPTADMANVSNVAWPTFSKKTWVNAGGRKPWKKSALV